MTANLKRPLFLAAYAHLALELCNNFLPVVYPRLINVMGLTFTQIGFVALAAGVSGSVLQPVFGYLTDRRGPVALTAFSVAWAGSVMGLVGFTRNYWLLLLLVGLGGLGSAAFHPPGSIVASSSGGGKRRGAALSVFSVGGNLGAALSPLLVGVGLAWMGVRGTFILIPVALLSGLFLYTQLSRYLLPGRFSTPPKTHLGTRAKQDQEQQLLRTGSRMGLGLIILVVMARSWFQMSIITYLPIWLEGQGWSLQAAGRILFVLLASFSIGSLTGGPLSDRIGRWQVVGLSVIALAVAHWLFLSGTGFVQVVFVGLIGVMIGASFPVTIVMAQELWPRRAGLASALVMGLGWLPGGVGASVTGQIADRFSLTVGLQSLLLLPVVGLLSLIGFIAWQRRGRFWSRILVFRL